jgi:hypothetical protein
MESDDKFKTPQQRWQARNKEKVKANAEIYRKTEAGRAKRAAAHKAWRDRNPERFAELRKVWRKNNKRSISESNKLNCQRRNKRLLTLMGRPMSNECEICSITGVRLHADHCHRTGIYRGWLCNNCNLALGNAKDNVQTLMKMVEWVKKTEGL